MITRNVLPACSVHPRCFFDGIGKDECVGVHFIHHIFELAQLEPGNYSKDYIYIDTYFLPCPDF
jgi:hypothetical protein